MIDVALVLAAATLAIGLVAAFGLRLLPTVLLYGYAPQKTAKVFHDVSGWIMLLVAFMLLMGVIRIMRLLRLPVMAKAS